MVSINLLFFILFLLWNASVVVAWCGSTSNKVSGRGESGCSLMHSSCAMRPRPLVGATQTSAAIRCLVRDDNSSRGDCGSSRRSHSGAGSRGDALDLTRRAESASLREI